MINARRIFLSLCLIFFTMTGCYRAPLLQIDNVSSAMGIFSQFSPQINSFKAFGDITFVEDGRRQSGKTDVLWDSSGVFKAIIYSPFGSQIASIDGDSFGGVISYDNQHYYFDLNETMEILPFLWAKNITFADFIYYLTGRMPQTSALSNNPDSLTHNNRNAEAFWFGKEYNVNVLIARRTEKIVAIDYIFIRDDQDPWTVSFAKFNQGLAQDITIKDDNRNYISVSYDVVSAK